jgi:Protein of unknown function (DUF1236)
MRRILLATTAAAALVAGSSLAMAQTGGGANVGANAGANVQQHQGSTGGNAGVRGNAGTQGNAGTHGMTQNQRGGQQGMQRGEHMGQARGEQRGHAYGEERNEHMGQNREQRGHAYGEERNERTGRANDRDRNVRGEQRNERMGQREQRNERLGQREHGVREGRGEYRGINDHVTTRLSSDQRTRIHERLFAEGGRGHRLGHVNFALREGVRIPRGTHLYALPEDIVTLVPAYRDYEYILVGDNIVIVDPATYEIVAVIPA